MQANDTSKKSNHHAVSDEANGSRRYGHDGSDETHLTDASSTLATDNTTTDSNTVEVMERFEDMDLPELLLRGIFAYGYVKPSAIQQRAIKLVASGRDLIAQAQSGTGKTGAFGIGTLATIDPHDRACQSLILAPTREQHWRALAAVKLIGRSNCAWRFKRKKRNEVTVIEP
eukprot:scaffold456_cov171-Amphora_coffeaeformis.AAC.6